jgi:iron(III) transport system ATP-binding protein
VQQLGTPSALFDYPANQFVANFVGTTNLLDGEIDHVNGDTLKFRAPGIGEIGLPKHPDARAGKVAISFRPHTIKMTVGDAARDGAYVWLDGLVEHSEFLGEFTRYRVRIGESIVTADQAHYCGMQPFALSAPVRLGIDSSQIRYLPA